MHNSDYYEELPPFSTFEYYDAFLFASNIDEALPHIHDDIPTIAFRQEQRAWEELMICQGSSLIETDLAIQFIPQEKAEYERMNQ